MLRARKRIIAYRRRSQNAKAKRDITILLQNKRCVEFLHVKQALFEIGFYQGRYLPTLEHKKKAGFYIRQNGLGKSFVEEFDDVVKWKWIHLIVDSPEYSPQDVSSTALPYRTTSSWAKFSFHFTLTTATLFLSLSLLWNTLFVPPGCFGLSICHFHCKNIASCPRARFWFFWRKTELSFSQKDQKKSTENIAPYYMRLDTLASKYQKCLKKKISKEKIRSRPIESSEQKNLEEKKTRKHRMKTSPTNMRTLSVWGKKKSHRLKIYPTSKHFKTTEPFTLWLREKN